MPGTHGPFYWANPSSEPAAFGRLLFIPPVIPLASGAIPVGIKRTAPWERCSSVVVPPGGAIRTSLCSVLMDHFYWANPPSEPAAFGRLLFIPPVIPLASGAIPVGIKRTAPWERCSSVVVPPGGAIRTSLCSVLMDHFIGLIHLRNPLPSAGCFLFLRSYRSQAALFPSE